MQDYFDFDVYRIKKNSEGTIVSNCTSTDIKFIILLKSDNYKPEMMDFLGKVMAAISVNLNEECIIFSFDHKDNILFDEVFKAGLSNFIISFGIDSSFYNVQAELKKRTWNNFEKFSVLIFDNLYDIKVNQDLKRKLWEQLKMINNV